MIIANFLLQKLTLSTSLLEVKEPEMVCTVVFHTQDRSSCFATEEQSKLAGVGG